MKYKTEEEKKEAEKAKSREYYYREAQKNGKTPKPVLRREKAAKEKARSDMLALMLNAPSERQCEILLEIRDLLAGIKERLG